MRERPARWHDVVGAVLYVTFMAGGTALVIWLVVNAQVVA